MTMPLLHRSTRAQRRPLLDRTGARPPRTPLARRVVAPLVAVGVLGFAALTIGSASLTASSLPLPAKVTGPSSYSSSLGAAGKKSPPCTSIKRSDLARLFTVAVGSPYDEGSGACVYGIGPNSKLKGPPIETAETDTFLAQLFRALGATQYEYFSTTGGKAIAFKSAGYKARYRAQVAFGQMEGFSVYVLKGTLFCLVDINLSSSGEVGLGRVTSSLPAAEAVGLAKRVVPLCTDLFSAN